jgi:hypothetical protein
VYFLPHLQGWPFGPHDPRAAHLAECLANYFVNGIMTSAVELEIIAALKSEFERRVTDEIAARYAIPPPSALSAAPAVSVD